MYCIKCGKQIDDNAAFCPNCGTKVGGTASVDQARTAPKQEQPVINIVNTNTNTNTASAGFGYAHKKKWVAFFLCFFLGFLGAHRFYVGKAGTGLIWLFTCGLFGFGVLIDLIVILCGGFRDKAGQKLI